MHKPRIYGTCVSTANYSLYSYKTNYIKDNKTPLSEQEHIIFNDIETISTDTLKTIKDTNSLTESVKKDILKDLILKSDYALQFYNIYCDKYNVTNE